VKLYQQLCRLVLVRPVAWGLIAMGVIGGIGGFVYWYGPTFAQYPVWQWPFVPDCPLFAFLFTISLALILCRRSVPAFDAVVAFGLIKYGVWTVSVWILYWIYTRGDFTAESVIMTLTHTGMILEGLVLLSFLKLDWPTVAASLIWFGLSDWMDYGPFKTYPHFPMSSLAVGIWPRWTYLDLLQWEMILATVALTALYAGMAWRRGTTRASR